MPTTTRPPISTTRQLALDEAHAWSEYLEATIPLHQPRYDEVEPWAWNRLGRRLQAINTRRRALTH